MSNPDTQYCGLFEGTLLCPAAPWGHDFLIFSIISFTFSFAKVFFF